MFDVREDDLTGEQTIALLEMHLLGMHANSPPNSVHALDLSGLAGADVTVWSAWEGDALAGVAALRALDRRTAEIKSMRTHPDFLRRGVATLLLEKLIDVSETRGFARLSLETGSGPMFEPAVRLYLRRGFRFGEPFGAYATTPFNQFMHLELEP